MLQDRGGQAERLLVTGAGGFIGHRVVKHLTVRGYWARGVDSSHPEYERSPGHGFETVDLRRSEARLAVTREVSQIYGLAADTGGIGSITTECVEIARIHMIEAGSEVRTAARASARGRLPARIITAA